MATDTQTGDTDPAIARIERAEKIAKRAVAAALAIVPMVAALGILAVDQFGELREHLDAVTEKNIEQERHFVWNDRRLDLGGAPSPPTTLPPRETGGN